MIGYCKYCGNSRIVQKAEHMTEEEINNQASLECNCEGAREERDVQELIDSGRKSLKLVGKKSGAVERALEPFVELIARKKIKKISVNFDGIVTASVYMPNSGKKIAVETRETVVEYSDGETIDEIPICEDCGMTEKE